MESSFAFMLAGLKRHGQGVNVVHPMPAGRREHPRAQAQGPCFSCLLPGPSGHTVGHLSIKAHRGRDRKLPAFPVWRIGCSREWGEESRNRDGLLVHEAGRPATFR